MLKNWKLILAVLLVFLFGGICGSLLTGVIIIHNQRQFWDKGPSALNEFMVRRLGNALHLNEEQKRKILQILNDSQKKNHEIMQPIQPLIKTNRLETQREIEKLLTPEQIDKFHELISRERKRMKDGGPHSPLNSFSAKLPPADKVDDSSDKTQDPSQVKSLDIQDASSKPSQDPDKK